MAKAKPRAPRPFDFAALGVPPPGTPKGDEMYADDYEQAVANLICKVIWITPEWATKVLAEQNRMNRRMKLKLITELSRTITNELWSVNGETIIFSEDGTLLDGQHRLQGVVIAETAVPCVCVFGVPKHLFVTLDGTPGRKRTDLLSIARDGEAEKSASTLAAALGWVYRWENDQMTKYDCILPYQQTFAFLDRYPGIRDSVSHIVITRGGLVTSPGLFAALHYIFGLSDAGKRDQFFTQVVEGLDVKAGSIAAMLRKWLESSNSGDVNRRRGAGAMSVVAAVVVKAWNVFAGKAPMPKLLKFAINEESFPKIL